MSKLADYWPIAELRVATPVLELRWPSDDDLAELAALAARGIHDADEMPFGVPWTRPTSGILELNLVQYHWLQRASWSPEDWSWNPVVVVDGEIVGTQALSATQFGLLRTVATGSWLGRAHQNKGIGTEMRSAVLHFAFDALGASRAETSAVETNPASLAVTRKLGYSPNGDRVHAIEGTTRLELCFVIHREDWASSRRDDIEITGVDACRDLFGAG